MKKVFDWLKKSKIKKYYFYVREELEDQKLNREMIGTDRDGNKYYQYYSYWGLPTRRQIRFKVPSDIDIRDLVYYDWLHKIQAFPPSENQKNKFYQAERIRYQRAKEWDQREQLLMEEFRNKRREIQLRNRALQILMFEMKEELTLKSLRYHKNQANQQIQTNKQTISKLVENQNQQENQLQQKNKEKQNQQQK